ncbi:uncharacterized protein LOC135488457 [Lineus longissimus]|uniref:uncharacterized protein LOC135488457 n=1 Tax=Lineus longissimus TaxID=88925 RepID=UPI00315DDB03
MNGTGPTITLKDRPMVSSDDGSSFYCESSLSGYPSLSNTSNVIVYTVLLVEPALPVAAIAGGTISGVISILIACLVGVVVWKRKGVNNVNRPPVCVQELDNAVFSNEYLPTRQSGGEAWDENIYVYSEPNAIRDPQDDLTLYEDIGAGKFQSGGEAWDENIYVYSEPNAIRDPQDDQPLYANIGAGRFQSDETSGDSQSSYAKENNYSSLEQGKMGMQPESAVYESLRKAF